MRKIKKSDVVRNGKDVKTKPKKINIRTLCGQVVFLHTQMFQHQNLSYVMKDYGVDFAKEVGLDVVFAMPGEVVSLNIGYMDYDFDVEMDRYMPFSVNELYNSIMATTIGTPCGVELKVEVPYSLCDVYFVIKIGDKYCKLNTDEWNVYHSYANLEPPAQIKLFQRLLCQGQITLDDLKNAKIHEYVMERLILNSEHGEELMQEKLEVVRSWAVRQQKNSKLRTMYNNFVEYTNINKNMDKFKDKEYMRDCMEVVANEEDEPLQDPEEFDPELEKLLSEELCEDFDQELDCRDDDDFNKRLQACIDKRKRKSAKKKLSK